MKKLTLQLESLQVQSFATAGVPEPRGTVRANSYLEQNEANADQPSRWWFDCFTITCICGASDKGCSGGCAG